MRSDAVPVRCDLIPGPTIVGPGRLDGLAGEVERHGERAGEGLAAFDCGGHFRPGRDAAVNSRMSPPWRTAAKLTSWWVSLAWSFKRWRGARRASRGCCQRRPRWLGVPRPVPGSPEPCLQIGDGECGFGLEAAVFGQPLLDRVQDEVLGARTDPGLGPVLPGSAERRRPVSMDVVGAENCVRAGQAACSYSWMMPLRRSRRRMCRCVIVAGSVIGSGSGCSGLEFEMAR